MTFEVAVVGTMGEEEERRGERKEHYNSTKVYLTALHQQEGRKHPNILGKGRPFKKKPKTLSVGGSHSGQFDFYTAYYT